MGDRLATKHEPKRGRLLCPFRGRGAGSPSNTISPGPQLFVVFNRGSAMVKALQPPDKSSTGTLCRGRRRASRGGAGVLLEWRWVGLYATLCSKTLDHQTYCGNWQILIDFQNPFTVRLRDNFATLPCEYVSKKSSCSRTAWTNYHACKIQRLKIVV